MPRWPTSSRPGRRGCPRHRRRRRRGGRRPTDRRADTRAAAAGRGGRAAQCRQIDADQPDPGRGPAADRSRGRDHPRRDLAAARLGGTPVRIFDTAGMRKKAKVQDKLEKLSVADGLRAVKFAEVVVVLLDAAIPFETAGSAHRRSGRARGPRRGGRGQQVGPRGRQAGQARASCARRSSGCCRSCAARRWSPSRPRRAGGSTGCTPRSCAPTRSGTAGSATGAAEPLARRGMLEAHPPPAPGGQADQAALHHPGQDPAARASW